MNMSKGGGGSPKKPSGEGGDKSSGNGKNSGDKSGPTNKDLLPG
jgi:hypothetical protein